MKLDSTVKRRFAELESKAEAIGEKAKYSEEHEAVMVPSADAQAWVTSVQNLLQRVLGEDSAHYGQFTKRLEHFGWYKVTFDELVATMKAAREDYEGGYLFNTRSLVKAEVLDDALEQASELLDAGHKDPACVVAGIALEVALKDMCGRNSIPIGKLDRMNADLRKAGAYNTAEQKQVTAWADLRNRAAHGEWDKYSKGQVEGFIEGVTRFIADHL